MVLTQTKILRQDASAAFKFKVAFIVMLLTCMLVKRTDCLSFTHKKVLNLTRREPFMEKNMIVLFNCEPFRHI